MQRLGFSHVLWLSISIATLWILPRLSLSFTEAALNAYFRFCNLSPLSVDLDDQQTTMHFWVPNHRQFTKSNLVLVHGYGVNSRWQFALQLHQLSENFNIYVPDLVFFGDSFTTREDRSDTFQAECVCEGLKKFGVERFSTYSLSYGGYVGYRMATAELCGDMVEKVVLVSAGIGATEEQKKEKLTMIGRSIVDLLVPYEPEGYRTLINLTMHNYNNIGKWIPDFFLRQFIRRTSEMHRKQKQELLEYLLTMKVDSIPPALTQETLLIWGEHDLAFPLSMGHELQRHLGPKSKLEIIKGMGHAVNMESPYLLNQLIISFVGGSSN